MQTLSPGLLFGMELASGLVAPLGSCRFKLVMAGGWFVAAKLLLRGCGVGSADGLWGR